MRFPGCVRQAQVLGRSAVRALRRSDAADLGGEGTSPLRAPEAGEVMTQWDETVAAKRRSEGRMLVWLRKQINGDLRQARADERVSRLCADLISLQLASDQVAAHKAVLDYLRSVESWHQTRSDPEYANVMLIADTVVALTRRIAVGYKQRPGWRDEWSPR
jgi:hypothetical protein